MKRSTERILTTHTGSLPRPQDVVDMVTAIDRGVPVDRAGHAARTARAVAEVVAKQVETCIDVVNDGEQGKPSYATYIKHRVSGFGGSAAPPRPSSDGGDFPEFEAKRVGGWDAMMRPACNAPLAWTDFDAVRDDIQRLTDAVGHTPVADVFMTAASPGVVTSFLPNEYYPSKQAYLDALVVLLREEYNAIAQAGFVLQLDCPDLPGRSRTAPPAELRATIAQHLEALNEATRDIPPEQLRLHLCWGNYEGPHHRDTPLRDFIDLVLTARPAAISFEGANPRHEHEWAIWQDVKLPADKVILPGVIDSTTNFVEHPELVAQRIVRYAGVVGRERVIASVDCGFATTAASSKVDGRVAWAKLRSLTEGAELASKQLWRR